MSYAALTRKPAQTHRNPTVSKPKPAHLPERSFARGTPLPEALGACGIQAKLHVGSPHDALERAADRAADSVMASWNPGSSPAGASVAEAVSPLSAGIAPPCQRESAPAGGGTETAAPLGRQFAGVFDRVRARGGQPLEPSVRRFMEPRFGRDFSKVRVHDSGEADTLAQRISARAFTHGDDIFFARGEYRPGDRAGARLIAHELGHVVQQGGALGQGRLSRSLAFGKQTADLTHSVYDKGVRSESPGLFNDVVGGLERYLGLTSETSVGPNGKRIKSTALSSLKPPGLATLDFLKPLQLPPQIEPLVRQTVAVFLAMAVDGIRQKVSEFINNNSLSVGEPDFETSMIMFTDNEENIYAKGSLYKTTAVAPRASWGGFWMILHELLHMCDWKLQDAGPQGSAKAYQDITTSERSFNWRGGGAGTHKLTETGSADFGVNIVRLAHGLPIRATYMDAVVNASGFPAAMGTVFRSYENGVGEDFYGWVAPPFPTDEPSHLNSVHSRLDHVPVPDPAKEAARKAEQAASVSAQENSYLQECLTLLQARAKSLAILEEGQASYTILEFGKLALKSNGVVGTFKTRTAGPGEVSLQVTPTLGTTTADNKDIAGFEITATATFKKDSRRLARTFNITGQQFRVLKDGWEGELAPPGEFGLKIRGMPRPRLRQVP